MNHGQLRADCRAIWQAGVDAVDSARLVQSVVGVDADGLRVGRRKWDVTSVRRIAVVGAGKAGAGMAAGLEAALGESWLQQWDVQGWINVPEGCQRELSRIHLHPARPAGANEPTEAGCQGAQHVLDLVSHLTQQDLCITLLSGGGSALLPLPIPGVTIDEKVRMTRLLSSAGANIEQLNCVRRGLSRVKGGGLARACRAGWLVTLIISDVIGDSLETIASGPTVDSQVSAREVEQVWRELAIDRAEIPTGILKAVENGRVGGSPNRQLTTDVWHEIIGNNDTAVQAAAQAARDLGYRVRVQEPEPRDTTAEQVGRQCRIAAQQIASDQNGGKPAPTCMIWGGEPVVKLAPAAHRGQGGRNQQLVLAAVQDWLHCSTPAADEWALISGGTDGEDGPTDAAGAVVDLHSFLRAQKQPEQVDIHLSRNDAYPYFKEAGDLVITGPTHTNVCDLRVLVVHSH